MGVLKIGLNVQNVVVSEFGRMASGIQVLEKCNVICAETAPIGFRIRTALPSANSPLFCLGTLEIC